jgi:hypothetical protein
MSQLWNTNVGAMRGIGKRATSEAIQDGQLAVLVERSTDGQENLAEKVGNHSPRDPQQGRRHRA